ncbi:MAG: N-acetyltransferase [Candidatus Omnitrophota bacterium]
MLRKARLNDIRQIQNLINFYAKKDLMLLRSLDELYQGLRDFWVEEKNDRIVGCAALHIIGWDNLAEIKSLAVNQKFQKQGIAKDLVFKCINDAKDLGIKKIFVLTYKPEFFKKFGFKKISHKALPHKIWVECIKCAKFPDCNEIALAKQL